MRHVCREAGCFKVSCRDNQFYNGLQHWGEQKTILTCDYELVSSDKLSPSGKDRVQCLQSPERSEPSAFCAMLRVWSYFPSKLSCVELPRASHHVWEDETHRFVRLKINGFSGVLCFRRTCVLSVWSRPLTELSQSTLPQLLVPFELRPERSGSIHVQGALCCSQTKLKQVQGKKSGAGWMWNRRNTQG